jgi:hypothetical protein
LCERIEMTDQKLRPNHLPRVSWMA